MAEASSVYLLKALQSLAGAASELDNRRYDNSANRAYYATFQAAVAAIVAAGLQPTGPRATWCHASAQALFVRELINRQKLYPAELRDTLTRKYRLR